MGSRTKIRIGILALCLCVAGCTAPQAGVEKPAGGEEKDAGGGVRTLTLAFETPSRAGLAEDGVTPLWEAGDAIKLSNAWDSEETVTLKAEDITENADGTNTATITTTIQGTLYAIYPADAVTNIKGDEITLKLPSSIDGSFAKAHIAVARSDKDQLFFRNAVSILEFSGFDSRISSIEIKEGARCSSFTVKYGAPLEISGQIQGSGFVTVSGMAPGKPIYIPVAPGATIPAETVFTFRNSSGAVLRRMTHKTALTPEAGGIYELGAASLPQAPSGAAGGLFSVSPSRQVFIAQANLLSSGTFASSQLDYGGLFTEAEGFDIWRPITADELNYLFSGRSSAAGTAPTIAGKANAIYLKCTVESVCGLLLFPDAFEWPSGIEDSKADCANDWEAGFSFATFDSDELATLEDAGCVFLPAAGFSSGGSMFNAGSQGYYLTSTDVVLSFHADGLSYTGENKDPNIAQSLRLVTDAF